jgi:hypothetical protein
MFSVYLVVHLLRCELLPLFLTDILPISSLQLCNFRPCSTTKQFSAISNFQIWLYRLLLTPKKILHSTYKCLLLSCHLDHPGGSGIIPTICVKTDLSVFLCSLNRNIFSLCSSSWNFRSGSTWILG